jgi:hypothetical protein
MLRLGIKKFFNYLFKLPSLVIVFSCLFANASTYLVFSFSADANNEQTAFAITELSKQSKTGAVNLDIVSFNGDYTNSSFNQIVTYCNNVNYRIQAGGNYNFKPSFRKNDYGAFLTIDELESDNITTLLHSSSGKPHKNSLGENIHSNYEFAVMFDETEGNYQNVYNTTYFYIRENDAKKILGIDNPTKEQYKNLIDNKTLHVTYHYRDEMVSYNANICNIILNGKYDDVHFSNVFGTYVTTNSFYANSFPSYNGMSINFDFGTSNYDTKRYLELIRDEFSVENFKCDVNENVFSVSTNEQREKIVFIESNIYKEYGLSSIVSMAIAASAYLVAVAIAIFFGLKKQKPRMFPIVNSIIASIGFVVSYIVVFGLNIVLVSGFRAFNSTGIIVNLVFSVLFVITCIVFSRYFRRPNNVKVNFFEVNI